MAKLPYEKNIITVTKEYTAEEMKKVEEFRKKYPFTSTVGMTRLLWMDDSYGSWRRVLYGVPLVMARQNSVRHDGRTSRPPIPGGYRVYQYRPRESEGPGRADGNPPWGRSA